MSDPGNEHKPLCIVDCAHDPVVPDANSEVVAPRQLDGPVRTGVGGEPVDCALDPLAQTARDEDVRLIACPNRAGRTP